MLRQYRIDDLELERARFLSRSRHLHAEENEDAEYEEHHEANMDLLRVRRRIRHGMARLLADTGEMRRHQSACRIQTSWRMRTMHEEMIRELTCGVCFDVISQPFRCGRGHPICSSCLESMVKLRSHSCPTCRTSSHDFHRDVITVKLATLANISVDCACGASLPIADICSHRASCLGVTMECLVPHCPYSGLIDDVVGHAHQHLMVSLQPVGWTVLKVRQDQCVSALVVLGFDVLLICDDNIVHVSCANSDMSGDVTARSLRPCTLIIEEFHPLAADKGPHSTHTIHVSQSCSHLNCRMLPACEANSKESIVVSADDGTIPHEILRKKNGIRFAACAPTIYHRIDREMHAAIVMRMRVEAIAPEPSE